MARTLSPLNISREQFLLLRSVALNQGLPTELTQSANGIVVLTRDMIARNYFRPIGGKLTLTSLGRRALRRYSGGKVQLIDLDSNWLLAESEENRQYRIGNSLADHLAKRVSGDT